MKLRPPKHPDAFNTWHRFLVSGRFFMAEFEADDGRVRQTGQGFRVECCVRGADPVAALERLHPVISSSAAELLHPTVNSQIVSVYRGRVAEPFGQELVAGVLATEMTLHGEPPFLAHALYLVESLWGRVVGRFERFPV